MITGHIPPIRRTKPKSPSGQQQQADAAQQLITKLTSRWEVEAVSRGSQDPSAQLQASRIVLQLVEYLSSHKSTCKHGAVRVLLQRQLSAELLAGLLTSTHSEVVITALQALQELACIVPAAVSLEAAPLLVQLLCCRNYGPAAARVLRAQLSHWRFSQLWPHWLAAGATNQLFQQLQQLPVLAEAAQQVNGTAASRVAESCVSLLALLAKLLSLSEQQVLLQLAPDPDAAGRWLALLVQCAKQQAHVAGSPASLQLQDSCCAVLAGMSHAPSTTAALLASRQLRQEVVQLLHGVLHRPCCVSEADSNHIQCWMHAATAASLPVLWQPPQDPQHEQQHSGCGLLSAHEEQQLLADITVAAAATLCNECFVANSAIKHIDRAAASLLAAALLPCEAAYGSHSACTSRFMAAVLDSSCCHVLLHALAVSNGATPEQAALLAAAAASATATASAAAAAASAVAAGSSTGCTDPGTVGGASGAVALAPVRQELQPEWLLLRMICAQCGAAAGNSNSDSPAASVGAFSSAAASGSLSNDNSNGDSKVHSNSRGKQQHSRQQIALLRAVSSGGGGSGSSAVQPHQVLRVVQAYSSHVTTTSEAQRMPGLLRSMHFLMCQSVLFMGHRISQQQQQQLQDTPQPQQRRQQQQQLQWVPLMGAQASRSASSSDSEGGSAHVAAGNEQLLVTAAAVLDLINAAVETQAAPVPAVASATVSTAGAPPPAAAAGPQSAPRSSRSASQLSWALAASVYVSLAITVHLQGRAPALTCLAPGAAPAAAACLSAADCCLALAALRLAAAALKLLLPVLRAQARSSSNAVAAELSQGAAKQQAAPLAVAVHEPLVCSLAAVQALATLSALLQPALPQLLWQCISSSSGYVGELAPAAVCGGSSSSGGSGSGRGAGCVTVVAAAGAISAAVDALDVDLQQLLSEVVMARRRTVPVNSGHDGGSSGSTCGGSSGSSGRPRCPAVQASVQAALEHGLQQELCCWAAAALVSCHGQLGTQTWQGALLGPCRGADAPFADVSLQLGHGGVVPAHAAVLAAGCPVLRQQLLHAVAGASTAAAGPADGSSSSGSSSSAQPSHTGSAATSRPIALKLSAAVDSQALQQALDCIYTGAAMLPHTALACALQLCSSCLRTPGASGLSSSRHAPPQQQRQLQQQRQQLEQLQDMQQAAKQQLHRLGMLARKLQLPLLASLTRSSRPQLGHCLPSVPLNLAALLPQQVYLCGSSCCMLGPTAGGCCSASTAEGSFDAQSGCEAQQQEQLELEQEQHATLGEHGQPNSPALPGPRDHPCSEQYLSMLAACAAHEGLGDLHSSSAVVDVPGQVGLQGCHAAAAGFADAFMVAPAVVAAAAATATDAAHEAAAMRSTSNGPTQQLQQPQVVYAYLPAHRVVLSACCPYFEALLSERWQHGSSGQQQEAEEQGDAAAAQLGPQQQQQQQQGQYQRPARPSAPSVLVPEADIHVAAALQHFLYSGTLQVQLPPAAMLQSTTVHTADAAPQTAAGAAAAPVILPNGCCPACHQARTLLRLWRCAELLLLPGLQAACLAAVEAAGWQLDTCCCLVLLADCCLLGVPAAADGLLEVLTQRADQDTAVTMPEWSKLPPGLQNVLVKAWAGRKRHQDADEEAQGTGALAGLTLAPVAAVGSLHLGAGPAAAQLHHCMAALQSVGLSAEPLQGGAASTAGGHAALAGGLVCLQQHQQQQPQGGFAGAWHAQVASQAVVLPLTNVARLEAAGRSMGAAVSAQLQQPPPA